MCTPGEIAQNVMYANRYQQIKKLGQGSYGTAYLVHDTKSKHERKVLKAIFIEDVSPNESLDAEHEAAILVRLRHPNIIRFYDSFIDASYFCIVTEYCEDGDLDQCLKSLRKQRSRLQMDQVIDLFIQLLSAIEFLHSKKILHRDIKTSNIFLKRNHVKLGDFGISRLMMNTLDKASTFIGTPFYMSPETLRYDGYNMKSDIWSLGCVLYELSMCKRAYERSNIVQTMEAILRDSPPNLPERFPVKIQQLYLQMLSKEPEKRLTAAELLEEFSQIEIKQNNTQKLVTQSSTPDPGSKPSHLDLRRSCSNSPLINKHIRNSLQVPSSSTIHLTSSMDSVESFDNQSSDDVQGLDNNFDPFSSTAKEMKTDFYRNKAQELIGSEGFNRVYTYLRNQHQLQFVDSTRTDDIILSGLETLSSNRHACTLINELVLHECLNELNERTIIRTMTENEEPQIFKKRYKIVKKLGAGNFGTAYLVTDLRTKNEPKVLKVVRLGEMDADQTVDSVREAELLSNLHNEHIVKFYESFLENDCLCIVTEFCEGGDFDQRFKELKKQNHLLEEDQVVEWLIQILIAVQYMHKSRILHRDLKARNIFLKANKVKIGDFGISRILVGTMDVASTFTGTPYYMSPEVMKHDGYESKSDIWSVGCLLYEMCTYQHAFDGKGLMNVIYKVVEGKPPELPKTYSKELNDLLIKMFTKDPKQRPSAAELLQTSFILEHRQRIKMNGPLENTITANRRLKDIHIRLQHPVNFGDLQKQSWSLNSEGDIVPDDDDDDDVQLGNNTFYKRHAKIEEDEEEQQQQTLKPEHTQKTARQTMMERKLHEADARAKAFTQAARSNALESAQSRQLMRESIIGGTMKQPWPSPQDIDTKEQTRSRLAQTSYNRTRNPNQFANEETYAVRTNSDRLGGFPKSIRNNNSIDDRPITPMRGTYRQIADKFVDEDGLPTDPNLTNQYYEAYNDFEKEDDQSPTREKREKEFYDQVCRSFNGQDNTLKNQRIMSASQRSTINSLSRTIDPRYPSNSMRQSKYLTSSRTIASTRKPQTSSNTTIDDHNMTLKDNPTHDAFGPLAKDKKITSIRTKAIQALGESTFEKVHDYLIKQRTAQRTDPTLDDSRITDGLTAFVKKPSDCFLVDQLVFLELVS